MSHGVNNIMVILSSPSGAGKTTVTLGLIRAFSNRQSVQTFKNGPDYIDTHFQALAANRPSYNLDTWAMSANQVFNIINSTNESDLNIVEGSMGLFDGVIKKDISVLDRNKLNIKKSYMKSIKPEYVLDLINKKKLI